MGSPGEIRGFLLFGSDTGYISNHSTAAGVAIALGRTLSPPLTGPH